MFVCDVHIVCESSRLQTPSELPQKASKQLQKPSNAYKSQKLSHVVFYPPKGKFHSIKCFAMYTAPTEKYWPEIIGETCFYKVDGVTYYGHPLKGTNGL